MMGYQEDIGIPWCICCTKCILSKEIHLFGPNISHSTVRGVKQTQMDSKWALITLHQKTSSFIVRGHGIVSAPGLFWWYESRDYLLKAKKMNLISRLILLFVFPLQSPVGNILGTFILTLVAAY